MKVLHELLWISEKEMRDLENDSAIRSTTKPTRFCVAKSGVIRMWPPFDPEKFVLFYKDK